MMRLAIIPFAGFYGTWHDDELDRALESYFQDPETGDPLDEFTSDAFMQVDWTQVHRRYALAYAQAWCEHFGIKGMEFDELNSPREYNFVTDRIFVKIPLAEVQRIFLETPLSYLNEVAAEEFTSRSGFISSYSPDVGDWGDLEEWDHNQVWALLRAHVRFIDGDDWDQQRESDLMETYRDNGYFENWISEAGNDKFREIDNRYAEWRCQKEKT